MKKLKDISISLILLCTILFSSSAGITADAVTAKNSSRVTYVYVTDYGTKYHRGDCGYLWHSKIKISLRQAKAQGYTPCSRCNPPR